MGEDRVQETGKTRGNIGGNEGAELTSGRSIEAGERGTGGCGETGRMGSEIQDGASELDEAWEAHQDAVAVCGGRDDECQTRIERRNG